VTFQEWTGDGLVRQAAFEGLREDKPAKQIGAEKPVAPPPAKARARRATAAATKATAKKSARPAKSTSGGEVAGITITHPERLIYPESKISKLDVARYYERMAEHILPFVHDRPLSIVRCPAGTASACFFQKHTTDLKVPGVTTVMIDDSHGNNPYIVVNSAEGLVGLAQMGTLELHAWNATMANIEKPDMLVMDFDPDVGLDWNYVTEAADAARALFEGIGLKSFLKTTGGKGLHVVVPITPGDGWDQVKEFSRAVALRMVEAFPDRFTATVAKAKRKGKIFIDYLRNGRGSTAVIPYSLRARTGAPVATPLAWKDLKTKLRSDTYNLKTVEAAIAKRADPWADYLSVKQSLTAKMKRAVGAQ
jgi:bifunctional non-homologous end joining protein LigD